MWGFYEHDMNVVIIGSGIIVKVLTSGFLKHWHEVVIGTHDPAKLNDCGAEFSRSCGKFWRCRAIWRSGRPVDTRLQAAQGRLTYA